MEPSNDPASTLQKLHQVGLSLLQEVAALAGHGMSLHFTYKSGELKWIEGIKSEMEHAQFMELGDILFSSIKNVGKALKKRSFNEIRLEHFGEKKVEDLRTLMVVFKYLKNDLVESTRVIGRWVDDGSANRIKALGDELDDMFATWNHHEKAKEGKLE